MEGSRYPSVHEEVDGIPIAEAVWIDWPWLQARPAPPEAPPSRCICSCGCMTRTYERWCRWCSVAGVHRITVVDAAPGAGTGFLTPLIEGPSPIEPGPAVIVPATADGVGSVHQDRLSTVDGGSDAGDDPDDPAAAVRDAVRRLRHTGQRALQSFVPIGPQIPPKRKPEPPGPVGHQVTLP